MTKFVSRCLNLAAFVGGSSEFFETVPKLAVFGFVAVGAVDVVAVAVGLNLLLALVVLL